MLDSLKRHCERLAADHLDCENVVDTYAYAKVSSFIYLPVYCYYVAILKEHVYINPTVSNISAVWCKGTG